MNIFSNIHRSFSNIRNSFFNIHNHLYLFCKALTIRYPGGGGGGGGGEGGACIEIRAQLFFFVEIQGSIFFPSIQGSIIIFFSEILTAQFFFITQGPRVSKSVCHWRTGAIRWWRTAIAARGVGTARSERVVDALRCILSLIIGPNGQCLICILIFQYSF